MTERLSDEDLRRIVDDCTQGILAVSGYFRAPNETGRSMAAELLEARGGLRDLKALVIGAVEDHDDECDCAACRQVVAWADAAISRGLDTAMQAERGEGETK